MKLKITRHRDRSEVDRLGGGQPLEATEGPSCSPPCGTQWLRVGWPPWGGQPLEACCRAAPATLVEMKFTGTLQMTHQLTSCLVYSMMFNQSLLDI